MFLKNEKFVFTLQDRLFLVILTLLFTSGFFSTFYKITWIHQSIHIPLSYPITVIFLLTTISMSYIYPWLLNFDTVSIHSRWEKKHTDAEIVFEQTIEEKLSSLSSLRKKLLYILLIAMFTLIFMVWSMLIIPFFFPIVLRTQIIMSAAALLVLIPIMNMMAFIYYNDTISHTKIYIYKGTLIRRDALVFFILGQVKPNLKRLSTAALNETSQNEYIQYRISLGNGLNKSILAHSVDYNKINALMMRIDALINKE
ncbi:MAG: hypothetical protein INQ03_26055 [Candidatus Heimdallarchaeota archaeon]|nr:hypothetical protein [Candidatus Heimdallarchaeota archaeon]